MYISLNSAVRYMAVIATLVIGVLMCSCSWHDEVLRVTSPDGKVDALLFEDGCGAPCSFVYEVRLARKGSRFGQSVAWLDAATRNDNAWGVNLKWSDSQNLSVEYLKAAKADLQKQTVDVAGDRIKIGLHPGVLDPQAPAGGMLYNLRGRPYDR